LALDLGSKRVGVAISDATGTLAAPLTTLTRGGEVAADHRAIAELVAAEEAVVVVVGLPLNMDGSEGPAAQAAQAEAEALASVLDVPVHLADERLTTVVADRALIGLGKRAPARRRVVDRTAATVLLQGWLDGPGGRRLRDGDGRAGSAGDSVRG